MVHLVPHTIRFSKYKGKHSWNTSNICKFVCIHSVRHYLVVYRSFGADMAPVIDLTLKQGSLIE